MFTLLPMLDCIIHSFLRFLECRKRLKVDNTVGVAINGVSAPIMGVCTGPGCKQICFPKKGCRLVAFTEFRNHHPVFGAPHAANLPFETCPSLHS